MDEEVSMMTPRLNFSFSPFSTSAKTSPKNDKVEAPSSKFPMAQFDFGRI